MDEKPTRPPMGLHLEEFSKDRRKYLEALFESGRCDGDICSLLVIIRDMQEDERKLVNALTRIAEGWQVLEANDQADIARQVLQDRKA